MLKRGLVWLFCLCLPVCLILKSIESKSLQSPTAFSPQAVSLIINEYLADPAGSSAGDLAGDANGDGMRDSTSDEFIEIVNSGPAPVNAGGFTISDATQVRFTFPAGKIIPPGEAAVIFGGPTPTGTFGNATANGLVFFASGAGLSLNNGGDTITVKDNLGATLATITYAAAEGNANQSITRSPDVTGGFTGHSTASGSEGALFSPGTRLTGSPFTTTDPVIDSISPEAIILGVAPSDLSVFGSNFQSGSQVRIDGLAVVTRFFSSTELSAEIPDRVANSPGQHSVTVLNPSLAASNAIPLTVLGPVGINEYMADPPDGPAGDANGDGARDSAQDEFIEIVNRTDAPFDASGYSIRDSDGVRFIFPGGSIIPSGEAAVIFGGGRPTGEFGNALFNGLVFTANLSLNNTGDTIILKDAAGNTVESINYSSVEGNINQSINRKPDIGGVLFAPHSAVAGSLGRLFSPGVQVNGSPFSVGPRITAITPNRVPFANAEFDLMIQGSGFELASVLIDSAPASIISTGANLIIARVPSSVTSVSGSHFVQVRNDNGNRSNVLTLTVIPPPPILTTLLPRFSPVSASDLTIILLGENFQAASVALVEGAPVATVFRSARELRATVPAALVNTIGSRAVRIRNADGQQSNALALEIIPLGARINSITPQVVTAGGPDFTIKVLGSNFKKDATVFFDDVPLATTVVSPTELQAVVAAALIEKPRLHGISMRNGDGGGSNEIIFTVAPDAPVIRSINPERIREGDGDQAITITGSKFQPGALARVVMASRFITELETIFVSSEELQARLPARFSQSPGNVLLQVLNPDFGLSNDATLIILIKDPLVINEYLADPPDGAAGDANGDGARSASQDEFVEIVNRTSEQIIISGYKLFDSEAVRHVFPAGTVVPPFESVVIFGGGTPTGRFGNAAANNLVFRASSGGLSLNNGGDTIRLEDGAGQVIQEIKFGPVEGNADQSFNRDPDADGAVFSLHTRVAEDFNRLFSPGAKAAGEAFTIKPFINALAPESARIGSADFTLTISGGDFVPGAVVVFNQTELTTIYRSSGELQSQVVSDLLREGGAVEVRVRNTRGELSAASKFLITDDPPHASQISPQKTGTGAENLEIRLSGERFQRGAKVFIQGEAVETRYVSSIALVAIAPARFFTRAGLLELRISNADGNQSNVITLEVENGPLITWLSRSRVHAGRGEAEIIIGGVAFKTDVVLFVNDQPVASVYKSETEFVALIPAEMTALPGVVVLQARSPSGGRSNTVQIRVIE